MSEFVRLFKELADEQSRSMRKTGGWYGILGKDVYERVHGPLTDERYAALVLADIRRGVYVYWGPTFPDDSQWYVSLLEWWRHSGEGEYLTLFYRGEHYRIARITYAH